MSVALVTTFYGSIVANFICIPMAGKQKMKSDEEVHMKEMVAEAVISIQAGENPRMLEQKLKIYLSPKERLESDKKEKEEKENAADGEETVSA